MNDRNGANPNDTPLLHPCLPPKMDRISLLPVCAPEIILYNLLDLSQLANGGTMAFYGNLNFMPNSQRYYWYRNVFAL